jgi:hypothetical protein
MPRYRYGSSTLTSFLVEVKLSAVRESGVGLDRWLLPTSNLKMETRLPAQDATPLPVSCH